MQQQEQQLLQKLAEARERQARAMKRLALAKTRLAMVEKRFETIRGRFQFGQETAAPGEAPVAHSPSEVLQNAENEETLISTIFEITQTEPPSLPPATDASSTETSEAVQRAMLALQQVKQALLDGTLSGPDGENALREAENALFQAQRAEIEASTNLEVDTSEARDTSETDITARLPIIRKRRTQESR